MIEMAIVGLGSWGLCVMERTVSRARRVGTPMRLHVVEPSQLGGGVYAAEQPDFLVLNNACGQLSLYAAPDGDALPPYYVGLHQWAVGCGYRWVGYECRIGAGGDPILPTDYLPRRLMGEYLAWFYDRLVAEAPPNLEIVRHYAAAVDISPALQPRARGRRGRALPAALPHRVPRPERSGRILGGRGRHGPGRLRHPHRPHHRTRRDPL